MPVYTDQLNRTVEIKNSPKRIVSLVPSQTELLHHFRLEEEVVGITKFCVHPQRWFREKQRIGGTKNVNLAKVISLQPDLILANKEENVREQVEELANHFPVWTSDVNNLADAYSMMQSVGEITGRAEAATTLIAGIKAAFNQLQATDAKPKTAYLIWKDPYMTVGGDTFIHHLMKTAGLQNAFGNKQRYPVVTPEDLQSAGCRLLLLSSEPYPFKQAHIDELQQQLPATRMVLVDGEMFSWYGSRLLQAPAYFQHLQAQITSLL